MTTISLPHSVSSRRKGLVYAAPLALAALGVVAWLGLRGSSSVGEGGGGKTAAEFYTVTPIDFDVKLSKDGELQAVNNIDIFSMVEGQATIQTLVKEGSTVKKGDVLIALDSAPIRQKIEDTTLDVQRAEADVVTARELLEIQKSQNSANLEAAEVALSLAQIDLKAYTEGIYPQKLADAKTAFEMALLSLKNTEEDLRQTNELYQKGFVTAADVKKSEQLVIDSRNKVSQTNTALKVLTEYTNGQDLASKRNAVSQAEQKLVRTQRENASNLSQKSADLAAKEQGLALQKRRLEKFHEQLAACTIIAPADGLVVYASSQDRNAQSPIQEGASVRERQALLRLPDTSSMKAVLRVQEAQVPRLREGLRASVRIAGIAQPIGATLNKISVLADNSQRWWNPDLKEYPVDLVLDETPATVKPGNGCQADVFITRLTDVLAVPISALYSAGSDTFVFASNGDAIAPIKVKVGETSDIYAAITDGLAQGQRVLVLQAGQGRELLEKSGIKPTPASRPAGGNEGGGGGRGRGRSGGDGGSGAAKPADKPAPAANVTAG